MGIGRDQAFALGVVNGEHAGALAELHNAKLLKEPIAAASIAAKTT